MTHPTPRRGKKSYDKPFAVQFRSQLNGRWRTVSCFKRVQSMGRLLNDLLDDNYRRPFRVIDRNSGECVPVEDLRAA